MEKLKPTSKPLEQQKKGYPKAPTKPITLDKDKMPLPPNVDTQLSLKESKAFLLKALGNESAMIFFGQSGSWDRWLRIILILITVILMTVHSIFG